jgi:hypothetical protein
MTQKPQFTIRIRFLLFGETGRSRTVQSGCQSLLKVAGDLTPRTVSGSSEDEIFKSCGVYDVGIELRSWDQYKGKVSIGTEVRLLDEEKQLIGIGVVIAINSPD